MSIPLSKRHSVLLKSLWDVVKAIQEHLQFFVSKCVKQVQKIPTFSKLLFVDFNSETSSSREVIFDSAVFLP